MQFVPSTWQQDEEYVALIADLLENEELNKLDEITHHHFTTRLAHSIFVSYVSYRIAKRMNLDARAVARAGLLHDFFLECREEIATLDMGSHNCAHPKIALKNAATITELNDMEQDIILKHMFMTTLRSGVPRYKESFVVTCVDKYCAISEVSSPVREKIKGKVSDWVLKLKPIQI